MPSSEARTGPRFARGAAICISQFSGPLTQSYSVCNLGGTFPRFFVLRLVDAFTTATCYPGTKVDVDKISGPLITAPFSCALQSEKERCINGGGTCEMIRDGYYFVNMICVLVGVVTFVMFIRPKVMQLQSLPLRAWRLSADSK